MKKKVFLLLVLLIGLLPITANTKGGYHVTVGNIFHYEMLMTEVDVTIGSNDYSGSGFSIAGHHLDQGTMCTLIVEVDGATYVHSRLYGGGYDQLIYSEWAFEDEYRLIGLIVYPMTQSQVFLMNPSLVANGLGLIFYPFLEYAYAWDIFEGFVQQTVYQLTMYTPYIEEPYFEATYDHIGDLATFESYFEGYYEQSGGSPEFDFDFKIHFKCVYDYDLATLQGMHYKVEGKGNYEGEKAKFRVESLTEKQYYDTPSFKLGGFDISEDWWILAAAGGGLLLVVTIFIVATRVGKKKKGKKRKKKSGKRKKR